MTIKHELRRFLWKTGYDISKYTPMYHSVARKEQFFKSFEIDTVFDIGANLGQFAQFLRKDIGYKKRILSFEPLTQAFGALQKKAKNDNLWDVFHFALGDAEEKKEINIAGNSFSSSILNILRSHVKAAPESGYIGKEMIEIKTVDSIFDNLRRTGKNFYMKIDTQGYESNVLKGAENSLRHIDTLQVEMSIIPLYEGQLLFIELCDLLDRNGYTLIDIENGFADPASGQLLQFDGTFHRFTPCR